MPPPNRSRAALHRQKTRQERNVCLCVYHAEAYGKCSCVFHQAALDLNGATECNCVFHQAALDLNGATECNCEFHSLVNVCSSSETGSEPDSIGASQELEITDDDCQEGSTCNLSDNHISDNEFSNDAEQERCQVFNSLCEEARVNGSEQQSSDDSSVESERQSSEGASVESQEDLSSPFQQVSLGNITDDSQSIEEMCQSNEDTCTGPAPQTPSSHGDFHTDNAFAEDQVLSAEDNEPDTMAYFLGEDGDDDGNITDMSDLDSSNASEDSTDHNKSDNPDDPVPSSSDPESHGQSSSDSEDEDGSTDSSDAGDEDGPPNAPVGPPDPDYPDNPDDPDDPWNQGDGNDPAAENNIDLDTPNFSLDNRRLDRIMHMVRNYPIREAVTMVVALGVRYKLAYDCIMKLFRIINVLLGIPHLPSTKDQLWSILNRNSVGIKRHPYCSACRRLFNMRYEQLPRIVACPCGTIKQKKFIKYFITLSFGKQLKAKLDLEGTWEDLQYRQRRVKRNPAAKEDIFDGDAYQHLLNMEGGMREPYDFSYVLNLDGFELTVSSNTKATPIFARINEVAPHKRQKYVFLVGLWVDETDPPFNVFMQTFVDEANQLSRHGIRWNPAGGPEVVSRFFPTCCIVDAPARSGILNHTSHSGHKSCTFCDHVGVFIAGMKFPLPGTELDLIRRRGGRDHVVHVVVPQVQQRTDAGMRQAMEEAQPGARVEGVIGPSVLMNLRYFDLVKNFTTDDLHPIYIGITAFHMKLLLRRMTPENRAEFNRRIVKIKTPTHVSRKPRPLSKKAKYRGTEWRNLLLYYAVPCLQGLLDPALISHFGQLSSAVHILCRDSITEADFINAERLLQLYKTSFQRHFGPQNMRFNIHMVDHLVMVCRNWSAFFAHSTFNFESWNFKLGETVTSPKASIEQMVHRYLLISLIDMVPSSDNIAEEVKEEIEFIMKGDDNVALRVEDCCLYGDGVQRAPTIEEQEALTDEGFEHVDEVLEFVRMKFNNNNIECRSIRYHPEEVIKSDNSMLFTYDNYFCQIRSIVVVGEEGNRVCGLFVQRFNVGENLNGVCHIVEVLDLDEMYFITPTSIRNFAIKVDVGEQSYIMPMANQFELD